MTTSTAANRTAVNQPTANGGEHSSLPASHEDGTRTAIVAAPPRPLGRHTLWALHLPVGLTQLGVSGRYFLARCGAVTAAERAENWSIYWRRPLFGVLSHTVVEPAGVARWDLFLPQSSDPGYRWLAAQPVGAPINLLGPLGHGFALQPLSRNLLLLADMATASLLLALGEEMLDRGGRVTLLLRLVEGDPPPAALVEHLPIAVEVRQAMTDAQWQQQLADTVRWADQIAVALPWSTLAPLAQTIEQQRFRLEAGFVQVLVQSDLVCGFGACLACVVPTRDGGYTRACVHGPVFDLTTLV